MTKQGAILIAVTYLLGSHVLHPHAHAAENARPPYKSLRYNEDYSFLSDPTQRADFWDPVKYIPIAGGRAGFMSFGGEARARFETYENELFSTRDEADNAYFLQRYLLHVDYHPTDWLRGFAQLQSSLESGRSGGPRPTDRDTLDIHQLFADLALSPGADDRLTLRGGRQEMSYGSERLVSTREGLNNRRAFDAVRLLYKQDAVSVDAFLSSPVEVDTRMFDDQNIHGVLFWGGYATVPFPRLPGIKLDLYYLGLRNPRANFNQGAGHEERHTAGTRFFGTLGRWDFNHEAMYQFGRFGSGDINAWSVATDHGYSLTNWWAEPRFGLKAAIASGDRSAGSQDLETFNPLFPRGNYFTEASLLGPQNFFDIHPCLQLRPFPQWTFETGVDFYWRQNLNDGIYTPGGSVIYPGNRNFARHVGTDFSFVIGWQATPHINISTAYTHFFAGRFIRQNNGEDVNYGALWASYRF